MIQRGEHAEHGPLYSFILEQGDILVISMSREQLTSILSQNIGSIESFDENEDDQDSKNQVITEAMVTPSSSLLETQLKMQVLDTDMIVLLLDCKENQNYYNQYG